jgi:hypothetical protein
MESWWGVCCGRCNDSWALLLAATAQHWVSLYTLAVACGQFPTGILAAAVSAAAGRVICVRVRTCLSVSMPAVNMIVFVYP